MRILVNRPTDPQQATPFVCCSSCGASLYRGDPYWQVNGLRFCEDCLDKLAKAEFAAHHRICGEELIP